MFLYHIVLYALRLLNQGNSAFHIMEQIRIVDREPW